ncbi:MAG: hypothetical protein PHP08_00670 [Candidatus Dojkabacteria bacterium]|nr:hypothetical protein [Candidatus Dojkabacteria bacterium]
MTREKMNDYGSQLKHEKQSEEDVRLERYGQLKGKIIKNVEEYETSDGDENNTFLRIEFEDCTYINVTAKSFHKYCDEFYGVEVNIEFE